MWFKELNSGRVIESPEDRVEWFKRQARYVETEAPRKAARPSSKAEGTDSEPAKTAPRRGRKPSGNKTDD